MLELLDSERQERSVSRSESSAPSDPFSAEAIVRCVQEAGRYTTSELHERGKYLRVLGVLPMAKAKCSPSLGSEITNQDTVAIAAEVASIVQPSQRGTIVQRRELTDMDRKVLTALRFLGGFANAKEIHARVTGASLFTVQCRLDRLVSDGRVRSERGRGYHLTGRA